MKVRICSGAMRLVSPSSAVFNSSRNSPATLSVVAIQNSSRATSAPTRYVASAETSDVTPDGPGDCSLRQYESRRKPAMIAMPSMIGTRWSPDRVAVA